MADPKPNSGTDLRLRRSVDAAQEADSGAVNSAASLTTTDLPHHSRDLAQRRNTPNISDANLAHTWWLRLGEELGPAIINYDPQQFSSVTVELQLSSRQADADTAQNVWLLSVIAQRIDTDIPLKFTIEDPRMEAVKIQDTGSKTGFRNFMVLLETPPLRVAISEELLADLIKNADPENGAVVKFRSAESSDAPAKAKIRSA